MTTEDEKSIVESVLNFFCDLIKDISNQSFHIKRKNTNMLILN